MKRAYRLVISSNIKYLTKNENVHSNMPISRLNYALSVMYLNTYVHTNKA